MSFYHGYFKTTGPEHAKEPQVDQRHSRRIPRIGDLVLDHTTALGVGRRAVARLHATAQRCGMCGSPIHGELLSCLVCGVEQLCPLCLIDRARRTCVDCCDLDWIESTAVDNKLILVTTLGPEEKPFPRMSKLIMEFARILWLDLSDNGWFFW